MLSLSLIVVVIVAGILCCCCLDWRPVPRCPAPPPPPRPRGAAWCWCRQGKGNRQYSPGRTYRMCRCQLGRPSIFSTGQSNNFYPHLYLNKNYHDKKKPFECQSFAILQLHSNTRVVSGFVFVSMCTLFILILVKLYC